MCEELAMVCALLTREFSSNQGEERLKSSLANKLRSSYEVPTRTNGITVWVLSRRKAR